jgi:hypothetical protein
MKKTLFLALAVLAALALSGCRFAVVESGSVRIEAPTPTPEATPRPEATPEAAYAPQG